MSNVLFCNLSILLITQGTTEHTIVITKAQPEKKKKTNLPFTATEKMDVTEAYA